MHIMNFIFYYCAKKEKARLISLALYEIKKWNQAG